MSPTTMVPIRSRFRLSAAAVSRAPRRGPSVLPLWLSLHILIRSCDMRDNYLM